MSNIFFAEYSILENPFWWKIFPVFPVADFVCDSLITEKTNDEKEQVSLSRPNKELVSKSFEDKFEDKKEAFYFLHEKWKRKEKKYGPLCWSIRELCINVAYVQDLIFSYHEQISTKYSLSVSAMNVLMILTDTDGYPMNEIADLMIISKASVTSLVDSLEQKGLVERIANPNDRRSKTIKITEAGTKLIEDMSPHFSESMELLFKFFTKTEIEETNKQIVNMRKKIRKGLAEL
jgi:DNA-binding MarR family transcriptional regulator